MMLQCNGTRQVAPDISRTWRHMAPSGTLFALLRAIIFQWISIGGLNAPRGDIFAPFGATWRANGANCSMQVARRKF